MAKQKKVLPISIQSDLVTNETIQYTDQDKQYLEFVIARLEQARDAREMNRREWDNRSYTDQYKENMELGFDMLRGLENPEDTYVQTGVLREKIVTIVSSESNLDFGEQVRAYDRSNIENDQLGEDLSDLIVKSENIEDWTATSIYMLWERAVQGTVFVEEAWEVYSQTQKAVIPLSAVPKEALDYTKSQKEVKEEMCRRRVIPGVQIYLGDIYQPFMKEQPFVGIREVISYDTAQALYGHLDRWKYVPTTLAPAMQDTDSSWWTLEDVGSNEVEIIKYQDKPNDEYNLIINGVLMIPTYKKEMGEGKWVPVGFPIPWKSKEYSILKGIFQPVHSFFAYGKGYCALGRHEQYALDEFFRMLVLNAQKGYAPPMGNAGTSIVNPEDLQAGSIVTGVKKDDLFVVGGPYGVNANDLNVMNYIKGVIDEKTVASILQGVPISGNPTAREVEITMQQARQSIGLSLTCLINLYKDLGYARLDTILEKYTTQIDSRVDEVTQQVKSVYRTFSLDKNLGERGDGTKIIEFSEEATNPYELYAREEGIEFENSPAKATSINDLGKPLSINAPKKPLKISRLTPSEIQKARYHYFIEVEQRERDTTRADRAMFGHVLPLALNSFPQEVNREALKDEFKRIYKLRQDFFSAGSPQPAGMGAAPPGSPQGAPSAPPAMATPSELPDMGGML